MGDDQIHAWIEQLDRRRLESLKVSLDQCWDLLRQRRALRDAGIDENAARVRDADIVEGYEQ